MLTGSPNTCVDVNIDILTYICSEIPSEGFRVLLTFLLNRRVEPPLIWKTCFFLPGDEARREFELVT